MLTLAAELNAFTKFVAMPMRGHGNVTGADMVMRWTTGYPFGINLSRGYPRFNPGEFSTVDLLVRGDNDAALILGADPGATMPQPAIDHLARIPDDRAGPQGDPHEPPGARAHHDGGDRHQRPGHRRTAWTRCRCRSGRRCSRRIRPTKRSSAGSARPCGQAAWTPTLGIKAAIA